MTRQTVIVALTLLTLVAMGNARLSTVEKQRVDRLVSHVMSCSQIPALGLALVGLDGPKMYVKSYGNSSTSSAANTDTRFCLGGATEAFTAVLLAKLLHENENITWTTPLQDIIGRRVVLSEAYRSENLNLKDILAQRTGYPNMDIVSVARPFTSDKLPSRLRYVQPVAGFREKFVPNQLLFSVLDEVLNDLANDTWQNLIKDHILKPLKMNSVMFLGDRQKFPPTNVAYPVVFDVNSKKQKTLPLDSFKGQRLIREASSLCLSPTDLAKWVRFLMRGQGADGQQLVDMDVLEETFQGVMSRDDQNDDPEMIDYRRPKVKVSYTREQQALGWIAGHYRGYELVSQSGSLPGMQTLGTILPEKKVAVFTSFTGKGGSQGLAAKTLINMFGLDVLMRGTQWFDETNICNILEEMKGLYEDDSSMDKHQDIKRTSSYQGERALDDFRSYYSNYAFGDVLVRRNGSGDHDLVMSYGDAQYWLAPTNQNDTFELIGYGPLWYTSDIGGPRIIAVFSEDPRDPENRLRDVTISGFDKTGDVLFSKQPAMPRFSGSHRPVECECGACGLTSAVSLLISLVFVSITIFSR